MYLYETHLHTSPVSACGKATVRESLEYYKEAGYAGVFITNHFIDGNFDREARELAYEDKIKHYFSAIREGIEIGRQIGLSVFGGIELAQSWAHFLVYGIDEDWCLAHLDMDKVKKSELLPLLMEDGALVIQAHPFREVKCEIALYPRHVHGVEIFNASRVEFENKLAAEYCKNYSLLPFAGSDNHKAGARRVFGGIATERPITDLEDFKNMVLSGEAKPFVKDENGVRLL